MTSSKTPVIPVPAPDPLAPAVTTDWRPSGWSAAVSVVETTPCPLTEPMTLVEVPPIEKARIAIELGFEPTLMKLPLPESSSLGGAAPCGSRRYCHLWEFGNTRRTYPAVLLQRTPTPTNDFFCSLGVPPPTVAVPTIPWSANWSLESAITEERYVHVFVFSPTPTPSAWFFTHLRLQFDPPTFWNAFTSSWL